MPETIREPQNGLVRASSAGESVFTDGDTIWLCYEDGSRAEADADALLGAASAVADGEQSWEDVGSIVVAERLSGGNPIYLIGDVDGEEGMYSQNTNPSELEAAVEAAQFD